MVISWVPQGTCFTCNVGGLPENVINIVVDIALNSMTVPHWFHEYLWYRTAGTGNTPVFLVKEELSRISAT
jgi:hypothetical protein